MDQIEIKETETQKVILTDEINGYLTETAKWGKFLAIVGYVGMGLLLLIAMFSIVGFSAINKLSQTKFPMGFVGVIYIAFAVVYYFPVTYLYRFSIQVRDGVNTKNQDTVTTGFQNLKSLFKFLGIFTIVILSMYVLILLAAVPIMLFFNA